MNPGIPGKRFWRFHIDLGSRMRLEPAVKVGAFTGEAVAEHLNYLMQKHEAPFFLKRDNGSNLNSSEVLSILKMFAVIPFNSPPGFPQFNGVMERSQTSAGVTGKVFIWKSSVWRKEFWRHFQGKND